MMQETQLRTDGRPDFEHFPKFSKLTLDDKEKYDDFIKAYPPFSEISFVSLMTWWNTLDSCAVAQLNGNLVISYWLPGDEENSGLSLIGTNKIDESIAMLLDSLHAENKVARLVHVPEFVLGYLKYPEALQCSPEPNYDECILPIANFYPLSRNTVHRQQSIKKFLAEVGRENVRVRSLDLVSLVEQRQLLKLLTDWKKQGVINFTLNSEYEATRSTIIRGRRLGVEGVGIFQNEKLVSFCLYQLPHDSRYAILHHIKSDFSQHHMFDFMLHAYAGWFAGLGVQFANVEVDWGLPALRSLRLSLGPHTFLKKYTVSPIANKT